MTLQHANLMNRYGRPLVELTVGSFRRFADHVVHRHVAIAEEDGRCTAFAISSYRRGIFHLLLFDADARQARVRTSPASTWPTAAGSSRGATRSPGTPTLRENGGVEIIDGVPLERLPELMDGTALCRGPLT